MHHHTQLGKWIKKIITTFIPINGKKYLSHKYLWNELVGIQISLSGRKKVGHGLFPLGNLKTP